MSGQIQQHSTQIAELLELKQQTAQEVLELLEVKNQLQCDIQASKDELETLKASKNEPRLQKVEDFAEDTVGYF